MFINAAAFVFMLTYIDSQWHCIICLQHDNFSLGIQIYLIFCSLIENNIGC